VVAYRHADILKFIVLVMRGVIEIPFFGWPVSGEFLVASRRLKG